MSATEDRDIGQLLLGIIRAELAPIKERLDRIEARLDQVDDSLRTIRATMVDMRDRQNGMAKDIQNIYGRIEQRQPVLGNER